ncbi:MAG: Ribose ABC transport system, ATP-binding protein RbsA [Anaerolineae bacterium]|nr:MAG: Ribose ABC transport system, ATP-binding protein RbsA [Anaerolineae bacterium]
MVTLVATGLRKTFPGVLALNNVDLTLSSGKIHGLIGANGAGKSTLIKILTGYYPDYEGRIEIDGRVISIRKPSDAFRYGIEVVHQEVDTTLIPYLTVAENLLIEKIASSNMGLFVQKKSLFKEAEEVIQKVNLNVNVSKPVADLTLPQKQLLVIARAITRSASFVILDEPTSSLSQIEAEQLFRIIKSLKEQGVSFLYVSHRLGEIQELADEVTILRNGEKVAYYTRREFDLSKAVEAMLGVPPKEIFPEKPGGLPNQTVMEVVKLSKKGRLWDISFKLYQGEILGITGQTGAGKTDLLHILFGSIKPDSGEIFLDGKKVIFHQPKDAIEQGIYLIPEDRRNHGLFIEDTVLKNISLPFLNLMSTLSFVSLSKEKKYVMELIDKVNLVPRKPNMPVRNLSGGNQQKVVVGKWLGKQPKVIIFDEATQGIDIGAKRDIYAMARNLSQTAGVIFASSDVDEVLGLADRVLVMRDGYIVAEFNADQVNRQTVMEITTGAANPVANLNHQQSGV